MTCNYNCRQGRDCDCRMETRQFDDTVIVDPDTGLPVNDAPVERACGRTFWRLYALFLLACLYGLKHWAAS